MPRLRKSFCLATDEHGWKSRFLIPCASVFIRGFFYQPDGEDPSKPWSIEVVHLPRRLQPAFPRQMKMKMTKKTKRFSG
jgi:hypothetical protein